MTRSKRWAHRTLIIATGLGMSLFVTVATAYPLDGYESTGIPRLQAQRLMQEGVCHTRGNNGLLAS